MSWVESTSSTNTDLVVAAGHEPLIPRVLFANEQTNGRGRLDRSWEMEPGGGIMVSFYVPWTQAQTMHLVPIALGVAIAECVLATGRHVGLKWPNDLVVASDGAASDGADNDDGDSDGAAGFVGKKLGGMLSASVATANSPVGIVAGLGCNVSWPPLDFAELPDAVALDHLAGSPVTVETLAAALIQRFDEELVTVQNLGADALLSRYRDRCVTIGKDVRVETSDEHLIGRATDIDPTGALLLEVDGRQHRVDVGDVVHLR